MRIDGQSEGEGTAIAWSPTFTDEVQAARSPPLLALDNQTADEKTFIVEDTRWQPDALHPRRLFTFQSFLDLFSQEYIASDLQLAVGQQTIVFTDMVGSTAFYSTRGDPAAFMEVKRHFAKDLRRGPSPRWRRREDHRRCRDGGRTDTSIRLHASLHVGPCIAVNLNSGIDYFGNTVNVAAKLQALSSAGQVALSKAVLDAAGVAEWIRDQGIELEHLTLKDNFKER